LEIWNRNCPYLSCWRYAVHKAKPWSHKVDVNRMDPTGSRSQDCAYKVSRERDSIKLKYPDAAGWRDFCLWYMIHPRWSVIPVRCSDSIIHIVVSRFIPDTMMRHRMVLHRTLKMSEIFSLSLSLSLSIS